MSSRYLFVGVILVACMGGRSVSAESPGTAGIPTRGASADAGIDRYLAWDATTKEKVVTNGTAEAHFTFSVTNISSEDVIILGASGSCGCTVPRLPSQPWTLAPGASGEIPVVMTALLGKRDTIQKTVTVSVQGKESKVLIVRTKIEPSAAPTMMSAGDRENNQKLALADPQAIFKGDCAKCHAEPAKGKVSQALYDAACGICHDGEHRAPMVPNLRALPHETNAEYWKHWITHGKPGTLMPAFSQAEGGILNPAQIASLVNYLTATIPSRTPSPAPKPAGQAH